MSEPTLREKIEDDVRWAHALAQALEHSVYTGANHSRARAHLTRTILNELRQAREEGPSE